MTPLLSIAVPTYNRAHILHDGLLILLNQHQSLEHPSDVEILIRDNCSPDDTESVAREFLREGYIFRYIRNEKNVGPDRNFLGAIHDSRGKYVWLLGDDDYLKPNAIKIVLDAIQHGDYGLIHAGKELKDTKRFVSYDSCSRFLSRVSLNITFISKNIFKKSTCNIDDIPQYFESNLAQIPAYLSSATTAKRNLLINEDLLESGKCGEFNGGFNPFKVFLINYFSIWRKFVPSFWAYEIEKYHSFRIWFLDYIGRAILGKINHNYDNTGALGILFRFYWECPYFYLLIPLKVIVLLPRRILGRL